MQKRTLFLTLTIASIAAGATGAACSAKDNGGFDPDDAGTTSDATHPGSDASSTKPDANGTPTADADVADSDAGTSPPPGDGGLTGHCSAVQGPACDLVLQDCPNAGGNPQECTVVQAADGGLTTGCTALGASQHLTKGHGCCPSAASNQCSAGLECIGDPNASCDGGTQPGRCTPHCCGGDAGDDFLCGSSDPEGIAGHCDLIISIGSTEAFTACSYDAVCKPFGIKGCPAGNTCIIKDTSGTAGCYPIYTPDGGSGATEGQPCPAANSCIDGLVCLGSGAVGTCTMMCLAPNSTPPFDAGALDGGPFHGGCSAGKSCKGQVNDFPAWVQVCQ